MDRDSIDPPLEEVQVHLVDDRIVGKLEALVDGCETCDEGAEYPFDWIIDKMMGRQPGVTDYLLERRAKCPYCRSPLTEKSLVSWK